MYDDSQAIVDQILTNVSLAYKNDKLIHEQIFPTLEVPDISGLAPKFDKSNLKAPVNDERDGFSRANRVDFNLSLVPFGPLREHALEIGIPQLVLDRYKNTGGSIVPETSATNNVTARLEIGKEKAVASVITTLANFPTNNKVTLSGTSQFNDYTNSDPMTIFQNAKTAMILACGTAPNKVVMGRQVYDVIINHPKLIARLGSINRSTEQDMKAALAALIGVDTVLIGEAVQNPVNDGQTDALSFIWGKDITFMYTTPAPALEQLSAGYMLQLAGKQYVDKWYEQSRKSQFVRANDFYLPWTVAYEAMYLIKNAVA